MFTGLVSQRGRILTPPQKTAAGGVLLEIGHDGDLASRLSLGASLAVSGVCLTVVEQSGASSTVEMGDETLRRTTLGDLGEGDEVNLEPSLALGDPLGGHWVQGHVDGVLTVVERTDREGHRVLAFSLPAALERYVVEKGSVTIDGVSLTVTEVSDVAEDPGRFAVWLIPHTLEITTLGRLGVGDRVNFEADVLAKYVERSVRPHLPPRPSADGKA